MTKARPGEDGGPDPEGKRIVRSEPPAVSQGTATVRQFRSVMGHFATGVSVITAIADRQPSGMTANAVASLSLSPMLVAVGFDRSSRTLRAVRRSERFGVNVLAKDQETHSRRFASKLEEAAKFADVDWEVTAHVPVLAGVVAWLSCRLVNLHPGGDHLLGVGEVVAMGASQDLAEPLLFFRGSYRGLDVPSDM